MQLSISVNLTYIKKLVVGEVSRDEVEPEDESLPDPLKRYPFL